MAQTKTKLQVMSIQAALNKKGANLKVDGIQGAKTNAAIAKYGGSIPTPTKTTTAKSINSSLPTKSTPTVTNKSTTTQGLSYNKYGSSVTKPIGKTISAAPKKTKLGNIFSKIGKTFKDALQGSVAKSGYSENEFSFDKGMLIDAPKLNQNQIKSAIEEIANPYKPIKETFSGKAPIASADEGVTPTETSSTMPLISTESGSTTEQTEPVINPIEPDKVTDNTSTVSRTASPEETSSLSVSPEMSLMAEVAPSSPTNANIINKANELATGLKNDLNGGSTAWMSNGSKSEFQNNKTINYATNMASQFTSPEAAVAFYKTPEGLNTLPQGVKPEDIISKVKTVTNGVVGAQTTPEYLTKLGAAPAALAGEKKVMEQQMTNIATFATDYEKKVLSAAEQEKTEAQTLIDALNDKELREEATIRDRANLAIDKLKAEQKAQDAEIEMNRIQGKANLTEFLAKIGALRTDGNAQVGLETLEQKYQAQRLANKNSYKFAIREAQINMSDKLNELESKTEEKILDINSDLSKSEREISLDIMKLRFDTQMKGLDYVSKFQDSIKTENEKATTRANKVKDDYTEMMWKLMTNENVPEAVAKAMFNTNKQFQYTGENAEIIKQYGGKKVEPAYKGETLKINDKLKTKVSNLGFDSANLDEVQKDLESGLSLQQIAQTSGMPNSVYTLLKSYLQ